MFLPFMLPSMRLDAWKAQQVENEYLNMNAEKIKEFREWIKSRNYGEAGTYTPDIIALEQQPRHPIFIHDEMLPGGINHDLVTETNLKGRWPSYSGFTELEFMFWHRRLGKESYPVALKVDQTRSEPEAEWLKESVPKPAKIWGNIYHIRGYAFKKLDFVKANGVEFKRQKVMITVPVQKTFYKAVPEVSSEMKYHMECWMYVGNPDFFNPLIDGGFEFTPVQQIKYTSPRPRDWLDRYYVYKNGTYE